MKQASPLKQQARTSGLEKTADYIESLQRPDGAIPWFPGGALDPWNHTEAMMGLSVAGRVNAVENALDFLTQTQSPDGAWWGEYGNAVPMEDYTHLARTEAPKLRDTNFCAYVATGVWHHYKATGNVAALRRHWPMVHRAINFVLRFQSDHGEISWCADSSGKAADDALRSGCSSIFKSLDCAIRIATLLDHDTTNWQLAKDRLGAALLHKPHRFDRTWTQKSRFSMDWYYPVLANVLPRHAARRHLQIKWPNFIIESMGCKCVSDQPWVTVAESCELTLALAGIGEWDRAHTLFAWQDKWRDTDGAYWMGYQYKERILWPEEKPSWTSAAVLLAADAIFRLTGAAGLFMRARRHSPPSTTRRSAAGGPPANDPLSINAKPL